jgi:hypothetical protein
LVAASAAALAAVAFVRQPGHAFLVPSGGAEWIRAARPFDLVARDLAPETVRFRLRFTPPASRAEALLHVQALRAARVFLNERPVGDAPAAGAPWRHAQTFDLAPFLLPGANQLRIDVENDRGPPVLLAWSPQLEIATHADWEAELDGGRWSRTQAATEERRHALADEFPSAWQGLRGGLPLLFAAFALGAGASLGQARLAGSRGGAWRLRPAHVRWLVLFALGAIGLHNLTRLHPDMGFDAPFHYDYIRQIIVLRRVPLASEGWQSFQAPLFYLIAAPPYWLIASLASEPAAKLAMRAFVLVCALGLVEMVHRAARTAFPERDDLQMIAIAAGGFLPMTVYMSHYVSNEPLAALLTAAVVVAAFRLLAAPAPAGRTGLYLGLLFGLSVLAKVTSLLLLPLLVAVLLRVAKRQSGSIRAAGAPLLRFGVAAGGVAGWYFARNWIAQGAFYLGGWDPSRGRGWNQDPGYRIPADLLSFGGALDRPIYAAFSGLWDGLYSTFWLDGFLGSSTIAIGAPPWRYPYAVACALLALPLTAAAIAGALRACRAPRGPTDEIALFSSAAVLVYLAAIAALFLSLPVYSTVKSTYTLGLAPCYGVLFASGLDLLPRRPAVRAAVAGYLAAWLAFVFRAYFS